MRQLGKDGGAAAVEMALVMPFLLVLVCGIIDFGRAYNAQISLTHAARESVRVWSLDPDPAKAQARAVAAAVGLSGVTATTTSCSFGQPTKVTVRASFTYLTPFIANLGPSVSSLDAEGVMQCGR